MQPRSHAAMGGLRVREVTEGHSHMEPQDVGQEALHGRSSAAPAPPAAVGASVRGPPAAADADARGCPPSLLRVPSSGRGACWAAPGQRDPFASAQWRAGGVGRGVTGMGTRALVAQASRRPGVEGARRHEQSQPAHPWPAGRTHPQGRRLLIATTVIVSDPFCQN
jgi:hypothetical protein